MWNIKSLNKYSVNFSQEGSDVILAVNTSGIACNVQGIRHTPIKEKTIAEDMTGARRRVSGDWVWCASRGEDNLHVIIAITTGRRGRGLISQGTEAPGSLLSSSHHLLHRPLYSFFHPRKTTLQCNAMQCNAMQCNAMQCNAMQCNAMQCNAMQ